MEPVDEADEEGGEDAEDDASGGTEASALR